MTRGEDYIKNAKCAHGHRSAMSNLAWCDLNKNFTVLKLHDMCIILNVSARNKSITVQTNFNWKVLVLKGQ